MARLYSIIIVFAAVIASGALSGCSENPADAGPPKIIAGASTEMATGTITPAGGSLVIDREGDSLDGLVISIPAGAYTDARTFTISSSPIERHELGVDFNPLTPLIRIENGGGYSTTPMEITIPCTIPDGHFAMAFVYDRATGSLEGMPLSATGDSSISVLSSNFSFSSIVAPGKRAIVGESSIEVGGSEIVVSSIPEARLDEPYNSGFVPGVDDWQFANYGSFAYLGHCAGQSASMMWYYSARKQQRNDPPLFGRFDNDGARTTPGIWADDVDGYRFCALAQVQIPWQTIGQRLLALAESNLSDGVTFNLFSYAIRLTKQPQFVWIRTADGTTASHAMVVYRTGSESLHIADPNYPGRNDRSTLFSGGKFAPYYSGDNASNLGVKYTRFVYLAQSTIVDFDMFKRRWGEVIGGTAGAEIFPTYSIHGRNSDNEMVPLADGFVSKSGVVELDVRNSDVPLKIAAIHSADQTLVPFSGNTIRLRYGTHLLGFHITDMTGRWVGFDWIPVEARKDGTVPDPTPPSESGSDCSAFFEIDGVGQLVGEMTYRLYPDGLFTFTGHFPGGWARASARNFAGIGTYPLHSDPLPTSNGTYIIYNNGASWHGDGTMSITRWDSDKVAGTFEFTSKNAAGEVVKKVTGQFQCSR